MGSQATTSQDQRGGSRQAALAASLDVLDRADNYRTWISDLMGPHLLSPILELGAGHGAFTDRLSSFGSVTAVEPADQSYRRLVDRVWGRDDVRAIRGGIDALDDRARFGSAVLVNVLEHIEDDGRILADIGTRLRPGGTLLIWVPAFPLLFSRFDRRLGHHRRYRRKPLIDLVEGAGFELEACHHANLPGWFSWLLLVRLGGWDWTTDRPVQFFDKRLLPTIRAVERRIHPPFGQSIFLAATKRSDRTPGAS